jgi:hypothetical protein
VRGECFDERPILQPSAFSHQPETPVAPNETRREYNKEEREGKMRKYGFVTAFVLLCCMLLMGIPGVSILFCQEPQSQQASGPLGLESVKPEFAPFFRMLSEGNVQVKYRMKSDLLFIGTNLVKQLSLECAQDFTLGSNTATIASPYKGGPVSEGPPMRLLQAKDIESFLSSKYFTYLAKQCASGTVHAATKKEIETLHKDFMFFAADDGYTIIVESDGVSIAYGFSGFDKGYLSWIDSFPTKKKKK